MHESTHDRGVPAAECIPADWPVGRMFWQRQVHRSGFEDTRSPIQKVPKVGNLTAVLDVKPAIHRFEARSRGRSCAPTFQGVSGCSEGCCHKGQFGANGG